MPENEAYVKQGQTLRNVHTGEIVPVLEVDTTTGQFAVPSKYRTRADAAFRRWHGMDPPCVEWWDPRTLGIDWRHAR